MFAKNRIKWYLLTLLQTNISKTENFNLTTKHIKLSIDIDKIPELNEGKYNVYEK